MVKGFNSFKEWFEGYENQYVIIGGTACDILMNDLNIDFRATKDLDLVLIVESLTPEFGARFWEYVKAAGYEHRNRSTGAVQFYRFQNPSSPSYPVMIELFSRKPDTLVLPPDAILTPLPIDEEISSLSAILLDDAYYNFLQAGAIVMDGVSLLDTAYIIPFKAKAWLDLSDRKAKGEQVDSKNIRKHKNDVLRLFDTLPESTRISLPEPIYKDMQKFVAGIAQEPINLKQLDIVNRSKTDMLTDLLDTYEVQR